MKVHLRQIQNGETHYSGEEDANAFGLEEADAKAMGPLIYDLDVGISEGGLFAVGTLELKVQMTCVACLRKFTNLLRVNDFAIQIELEGSETIDLTPEIREDIFLSLPPYPKCDASGETRCPSQFPKASAPPQSEPTEENAAVWAALDQLKTQPSKDHGSSQT